MSLAHSICRLDGSMLIFDSSVTSSKAKVDVVNNGLTKNASNVLQGGGISSILSTEQVRVYYQQPDQPDFVNQILNYHATETLSHI